MPCHFIISVNNTKVDGSVAFFFLGFFFKCTLRRLSKVLLISLQTRRANLSHVNESVSIHTTSGMSLTDQGLFTNI